MNQSDLTCRRRPHGRTAQRAGSSGRLRPVFVVGLTAALLFVVWLMARSTPTLTDPRRFEPRREGRILSVQELKPNEKVVIVIHRPGRDAEPSTLYQIEGAPLRMSVRSLGSLDSTTAAETPLGPTVLGKLSAEEVSGLDAFLFVLRRGDHAAADGTEHIIAGYYRDGVKIGEERFRASKWTFSHVSRKNGRLVRGDRDYTGNDPVFREAVPPNLIEERLKERADLAH